jgi:acyl-CoA reductase-like NAD-dependent aldehyde dehydrogenase
METYCHYISSVWATPSSGTYFDTENSYTGEVWAQIARGNAEDADRAVSYTVLFGGYKCSGQGRESGQQAIKNFYR